MDKSAHQAVNTVKEKTSNGASISKLAREDAPRHQNINLLGQLDENGGAFG